MGAEYSCVCVSEIGFDKARIIIPCKNPHVCKILESFTIIKLGQYACSDILSYNTHKISHNILLSINSLFILYFTLCPSPPSFTVVVCSISLLRELADACSLSGQEFSCDINVHFELLELFVTSFDPDEDRTADSKRRF